MWGGWGGKEGRGGTCGKGCGRDEGEYRGCEAEGGGAKGGKSSGLVVYRKGIRGGGEVVGANWWEAGGVGGVWRMWAGGGAIRGREREGTKEGVGKGSLESLEEGGGGESEWERGGTGNIRN